MGKSSTVNHLIHEEVAKTSDCQSETRSTTEHILVTADPNLAANDVSLSIVDPPGFNDADGLEQDARNLRSIEKFFRHHPSLMGQAYPNIILVTVPSTDVRFQGKNSRFMKCLRAIQRLHLVDRVNPNIVVVMTWACALPPRQLRIKMEKIHAVVLDAIHIDAPVVCLENLPDDFGLETVGDYTQLPDGTLQPRNLFEAMISVAKKAGDEFAQHCLSTYFDSDMEKVKIVRGLSEPARIFGLNSKEIKLLERLKNDMTWQQSITEVAQKIDAFMEINPLTEVIIFRIYTNPN